MNLKIEKNICCSFVHFIEGNSFYLKLVGVTMICQELKWQRSHIPEKWTSVYTAGKDRSDRGSMLCDQWFPCLDYESMDPGMHEQELQLSQLIEGLTYGTILSVVFSQHGSNMLWNLSGSEYRRNQNIPHVECTCAKVYCIHFPDSQLNTQVLLGRNLLQLVCNTKLQKTERIGQNQEIFFCIFP